MKVLTSVTLLLFAWSFADSTPLFAAERHVPGETDDYGFPIESRAFTRPQAQSWRGSFGFSAERPRLSRDQVDCITLPASQTSVTSRLFSYSPQSISKGDTVKVITDTRLMRGAEILETVPESQRLQVLEVRGPWIGVAVNVDGKQIGGWLSQRDLSVEQFTVSTSHSAGRAHPSP